VIKNGWINLARDGVVHLPSGAALVLAHLDKGVVRLRWKLAARTKGYLATVVTLNYATKVALAIPEPFAKRREGSW